MLNLRKNVASKSNKKGMLFELALPGYECIHAEPNGLKRKENQGKN